MSGIDIEGTLSAHVPYPRLGQVDCEGCDWSGSDHAAHVAAVLRTQIEAALAEAWDEGERHESEYLATWGQFCPQRTCNPYRAAHLSSDTEETAG